MRIIADIDLGDVADLRLSARTSNDLPLPADCELSATIAPPLGGVGDPIVLPVTRQPGDVWTAVFDSSGLAATGTWTLTTRITGSRKGVDHYGIRVS